MNKLRQKNAKKLRKKTILPHGVAGKLIKNKLLSAIQYYKIGKDGLLNLKDAKDKLMAGLIAEAQKRADDKVNVESITI